MVPDGLSVAMQQTSSYAGKTLAERVTGRFYTPNPISSHLVSATVENLKKARLLKEKMSISDPFCGDGRLVAQLMIALSKSKLKKAHVFLQDCDKDAVREATQRVIAVANAYGLDVQVECKAGDSFLSPIKSKVDVLITNPPWEILKPDRRETQAMTRVEEKTYTKWLKARSELLHAEFPEAKESVGYGPWTVSLARCGFALALRNVSANGTVSIVLPAPLLADQASAKFREHLWSKSRLVDLAVFPAEAKAFSKVDQIVLAGVFRLATRTGVKARVTQYDSKCEESYSCPLKVSKTQLKQTGFALPVSFGLRSYDLIGQFSKLRTFESYEGEELWAGRELDETGLQEKLVTRGRSPFVKGRMIDRFQVKEQPSQHVDISKFVPTDSSKYERIVWRDISRPSQKRRMIAALIPENWIAGNSLHVAHFLNGDRKKTRAMLAVLNSFVFEFQVRCILATGHMSLGIVRRSRVPNLCGETVRYLASICERCIEGAVGSDVELEIAVAKAYGLAREDFSRLVNEFPKIDADEKQALLCPEAWKRVNE